MVTGIQPIIFLVGENFHSVNEGQLFGLNREWWSLIIQLIVGIVSAFAVVYASNRAMRWSKQNLAKNENRIVRYFIGNMKMLRAGISFYTAVDLGAVDNINTSTKAILEELKKIYSDIYKQRDEISALLPKEIEMDHFLNLLLIIQTVLYCEKGSPNDNYDSWRDLEDRLQKFIKDMENYCSF